MPVANFSKNTEGHAGLGHAGCNHTWHVMSITQTQTDRREAVLHWYASLTASLGSLCDTLFRGSFRVSLQQLGNSDKHCVVSGSVLVC